MCSLCFQLPFCLSLGGGRVLGEVACISPTGRVSGEMEEQVHFCPSQDQGIDSICQIFGYGVVLFLQLKPHENRRLENVPNGQEERCNCW